MKKKIAILGSTGSIGLTTLNILGKNKKSFKLELLSTNKNIKMLRRQIRNFKVKNIIIHDEKKFHEYRLLFQKRKINVYQNVKSFKMKYKDKLDYVMSSITGLSGLEPTLEIIQCTKRIAIANKESIICGWSLIKKKLKKYNTNFIPIDSEHFSIYELIKNENSKNIKKIYITASGGPFLKINKSKLNKFVPKNAIKHPTWKMGKKISIDSSTLMNKILELSEAEKFFNIPNNKLDILIHPESLVHAVVEFNNGLIKFIYHETSMIIPLANAIFEKNLKIDEFLREKNKNHSKTSINNLTFKKVDQKIFPIITLKNRINEHPSTSIIINASNEVLVDLFLSKKITFLSIYKIIMTILGDRNYKKYAIRKPKNINQIIEIDMWARNMTLQKALRHEQNL